MDAVLYRGELPRGELEAVVGTGDRQARRIAATPLDLGVLVSESSRTPIRLAFSCDAGVALDAGSVSGEALNGN